MNQTSEIPIWAHVYLAMVAEQNGKIPTDSKPYGGYELKLGDNDKQKKWGGEARKDGGSLVSELQADLFQLGYWINKGLTVPATGQPMTYDGDFGKGVYSGLKTFQYEHKTSHSLKVCGCLDPATAKLIKQFRKQPQFNRPGVTIDLSKLAEEKFCSSATTKPERPTRFYQLPPSPTHRYCRYGDPIYATGGELNDVYHNELWGSRDTIDALVSLCNGWNETVQIGDISAWNGVDIGHSTHRDGFGLDIRTATIGTMVLGSEGNNSFSKENSVDFARIAQSMGFGRIITLCPHITRQCNGDGPNYVTQIDGHHHHLHIDFWPEGGTMKEHLERFYCQACCLTKTCKSEHKGGKQ